MILFKTNKLYLICKAIASKHLFLLIVMNRFQQIINVHSFCALNDDIKQTWLFKIRKAAERWKRNFCTSVNNNATTVAQDNQNRNNNSSPASAIISHQQQQHRLRNTKSGVQQVDVIISSEAPT